MSDHLLNVLDKMATVSLEQAKALRELKTEMAKATIVINMQGDKIDQLENQVRSLSPFTWPGL